MVSIFYTFPILTWVVPAAVIGILIAVISVFYRDFWKTGNLLKLCSMGAGLLGFAIMIWNPYGIALERLTFWIITTLSVFMISNGVLIQTDTENKEKSRNFGQSLTLSIICTVAFMTIFAVLAMAEPTSVLGSLYSSTRMGTLEQSVVMGSVAYRPYSAVSETATVIIEWATAISVIAAVVFSRIIPIFISIIMIVDLMSGGLQVGESLDDLVSGFLGLGMWAFTYLFLNFIAPDILAVA